MIGLTGLTDEEQKTVDDFHRLYYAISGRTSSWTAAASDS